MSKLLPLKKLYSIQLMALSLPLSIILSCLCLSEGMAQAKKTMVVKAKKSSQSLVPPPPPNFVPPPPPQDLTFISGMSGMLGGAYPIPASSEKLTPEQWRKQLPTLEKELEDRKQQIESSKLKLSEAKKKSELFISLYNEGVISRKELESQRDTFHELEQKLAKQLGDISFFEAKLKTIQALYGKNAESTKQKSAESATESAKVH